MARRGHRPRRAGNAAVRPQGRTHPGTPRRVAERVSEHVRAARRSDRAHDRRSLDQRRGGVRDRLARAEGAPRLVSSRDVALMLLPAGVPVAIDEAGPDWSVDAPALAAGRAAVWGREPSWTPAGRELARSV